MASTICAPGEWEDRREGEGRAGEGRPADPPTGPESMGSCVTPHARNPEVQDWKLLACGVDTLDLAAYIKWDDDWWQVSKSLEEGKERARKEDKPLLWKETEQGPCLVYPTGKPPMFRYHLQLCECHIFFGISQFGKDSPNGYVSINAKTLWALGVEKAVGRAVALIRELGGSLLELKPSRCDLCADFLMPGGVPLTFLRDHGVPEDIFKCDIFKGAKLETHYIGSTNAAIRARIYDKGKEVIAHQKHWFLEVWHLEKCEDVWRVEFQVRRPALKAYGVDSVQDLLAKLGGIWTDLSTDWYSLRVRDNARTARRGFHPWWQAVQAVAEKLGPVVQVSRDLSRSGRAGADWYSKRAANLLPSYAATLGLAEIDEALWQFGDAIRKHWQEKDFNEAYLAKVVDLTVPADPDGAKEGDDECPF